MRCPSWNLNFPISVAETFIIILSIVVCSLMAEMNLLRQTEADWWVDKTKALLAQQKFRNFTLVLSIASIISLPATY